MIWNVFLDGMIGSIPFFGDIFDVFFKANTRNVKLLREVQTEQARGKVSLSRHFAYFAIIGSTLLLVVALVITSVVLILRWIISVLGPV